MERRAMLCDCGKKNCIISSKDAFNQYNRRREILEEQREAATCKCGCGLSNYDISNVTVSAKFRSHIRIRRELTRKKNMVNMAKCEIVQYFHEIDYERRDILSRHNALVHTMDKMTAGIEKGYVMNLKLKGLLKNMSDSYMELLKNRQPLEFQLSEYAACIKKLKQENKRLKFIICSGGNDDDDDSDDECDVCDAGDVIAGDAGDAGDVCDAGDVIAGGQMDGVNGTGGDVLKLYENLKSYMIRNRCGIGRIARRNKANIAGIKNKFITIKHDRIIKAHPKEDTIKSDGEFLQLITDY